MNELPVNQTLHWLLDPIMHKMIVMTSIFMIQSLYILYYIINLIHRFDSIDIMIRIFMSYSGVNDVYINYELYDVCFSECVLKRHYFTSVTITTDV